MCEISQITFSKEELDLFKHSENIIEKNKDAFLEVTEALYTIWKYKLYKLAYDNFEQYLEERWGFSRYTALRHIREFENNKILLLQGCNKDNLPKSQKQNLLLCRIPTALRGLFWEAQLEKYGGKVNNISTKQLILDINEYLLNNKDNPRVIDITKTNIDDKNSENNGYTENNKINNDSVQGEQNRPQAEEQTEKKEENNNNSYHMENTGNKINNNDKLQSLINSGSITHGVGSTEITKASKPDSYSHALHGNNNTSYIKVDEKVKKPVIKGNILFIDETGLRRNLTVIQDQNHKTFYAVDMRYCIRNDCLHSPYDNLTIFTDLEGLE